MFTYLYQPRWAVDQETGQVVVSGLDSPAPDDPDPANWQSTQRVTIQFDATQVTSEPVQGVQDEEVPT